MYNIDTILTSDVRTMASIILHEINYHILYLLIPTGCNLSIIDYPLLAVRISVIVAKIFLFEIYIYVYW